MKAIISILNNVVAVIALFFVLFEYATGDTQEATFFAVLAMLALKGAE